MVADRDAMLRSNATGHVIGVVEWEVVHFAKVVLKYFLGFEEQAQAPEKTAPCQAH